MRSRMVFNYGTELSDALIQGGNAILGGVFSEIGGGKNYFMFAKDMRRWFHKIRLLSQLKYHSRIMEMRTKMKCGFFDVCKFSFLVVMACVSSCDVKYDNQNLMVRHYIVERPDFTFDAYVCELNDTLSQTTFAVTDKHKLSVGPSTFYFYNGKQEKVKDPKYMGRSIKNLYASTSDKTFREMSSVLRILKEEHLIDSITHIYLPTQQVFDIGLEISAVLNKKGAYRKYIEEAISNSSIEEKLDSVLFPFNKRVAQIVIRSDFKPCGQPIEYYDIQELGLKPSHFHSSDFIFIPLRIELKAINKPCQPPLKSESGPMANQRSDKRT